MSIRSQRPGSSLHNQSGFTLVELVVAMAAGMIVATALFTILDVSLRSTTRTFSRIDATSRARNALDRVGNEMHSACVVNSVIPVISGSGDSTLSFWSQYGNGVALTPVKHTLTFASNKLTDTTYPVLSGNPPDWTASGTPSSTETLLTNVDQSGSTPVFKYYSSSVTGQVLQTPSPSTGLSATQVRDTTSVTITLVVRPAGGSNEDASLVPNTVTNSISLRLSPIPNAGAPNQDTKDFQPCE